MTTIAWPDDFEPQACSIGLQKSVQRFTSPFNGTPQIIDFNAERWVLTLRLRAARRSATAALPGAIEALLMRLAGGVDWVTCWHFARPVPAGTARGTPTLSVSVARGASALPVTGATSGGTYRPGDMLGCGGQLFMVRDLVTLDGSGAGSVSVVNRVRAAISSGAAVTWNKPTATFAMTESLGQVAHVPGALEPASVDLVEVW